MHVMYSQKHTHDSVYTAWSMACASELLQMLRRDADIGPAVTPEPQESLGTIVENAFHCCAVCLKHQLHAAMARVLDGTVDDSRAMCECVYHRKCADSVRS